MKLIASEGIAVLLGNTEIATEKHRGATGKHWGCYWEYWGDNERHLHFFSVGFQCFSGISVAFKFRSVWILTTMTFYRCCIKMATYINYSLWQEFWLTVEDSEYFLGLFVPEGPGPEGRVLPATEPHKARAK